MSFDVSTVQIAAIVAIVAICIRWRHRLTSSQQLISGINELYQWLDGNRDKVLLYTRFAQIVAGLLFLLFGFYIGRDHLHLIRAGVRTEGIIVDYKWESFPGRMASDQKSGLMPIVKFQTRDTVVQFKDWKGSNAPLPNVRVVVLYDTANPSLAMIDRPVWNWIPWGPMIVLGVFLIVVGIKGFCLGLFNVSR